MKNFAVRVLLLFTTCSMLSLAANAQNYASGNAKFADAKFATIGQQGLDLLSAGDIDKWMMQFDENARYQWNSGDSLVGKAAIAAYWKKRRTEVLESITFSNSIWLPVDVKKAQATETPGIWLLGWYMVHAKYKNGNEMVQWIHTDMHFNSSGKIDQFIQYLDREPINKAMKG